MPARNLILQTLSFGEAEHSPLCRFLAGTGKRPDLRFGRRGGDLFQQRTQNPRLLTEKGTAWPLHWDTVIPANERVFDVSYALRSRMTLDLRCWWYAHVQARTLAPGRQYASNAGEISNRTRRKRTRQEQRRLGLKGRQRNSSKRAYANRLRLPPFSAADR